MTTSVPERKDEKIQVAILLHALGEEALECITGLMLAKISQRMESYHPLKQIVYPRKD